METLETQQIPQDPFAFLERWLEDSRLSGNKYYNAMTLASVDPLGHPDGRVVLYKGRDQDKIKFFTNYQSVKTRDLEKNPRCSLIFFWPESHRQVRIKGEVTRMSQEDSRKYFYSRPRSSQISALISPQSQVIPNRAHLEKLHLEAEKRYAGKEIPFPDYWGGHYVTPLSFEFWVGQEHRLHDRYLYQRESTQTREWKISLLAP